MTQRRSPSARALRFTPLLVTLFVGACAVPQAPAAAPVNATAGAVVDASIYADSVPFRLESVHGHGQNVVAVGYWGNTLRSEDAGATWQRVQVDVPPASASYPNDHFSGVHWDGTAWYAAGGAGSGFLYRSDDGGRSWSRLAPEHRFATLTDVWAKGDLILASAGGFIYRSEDAGATWSAIEIDTDYGFKDLWGDRSTVVAVGYHSYSNMPLGRIYRSIDGGLTWSMARLPELRARLGGVWGENGVWVAAGDGYLLRSEDDGLTWDVVAELMGGGWFQLDTVHGDGPRVFVAGRNGAVLRSFDGGSTWGCVRAPREQIGGIWTADSLIVTVGGEGRAGFVSRSLDGGENWEGRCAGDEDCGSPCRSR